MVCSLKQAVETVEYALTVTVSPSLMVPTAGVNVLEAMIALAVKPLIKNSKSVAVTVPLASKVTESPGHNTLFGTPELNPIVGNAEASTVMVTVLDAASSSVNGH